MPFIDEETGDQSNRVTFSLRCLILCQNKELNLGSLTSRDHTLLTAILSFLLSACSESEPNHCPLLSPGPRVQNLQRFNSWFPARHRGKSFGFVGLEGPIDLTVPWAANPAFGPKPHLYPPRYHVSMLSPLDIWEVKPFSSSYAIVYWSHTVAPMMHISS